MLLGAGRASLWPCITLSAPCRGSASNLSLDLLPAECGFLCPFLGFLGEAAAWLGLSSTNGGVFLVSEGFEAYVGPMLGHKNSKHKKKSVGNLCLGMGILRR